MSRHLIIPSVARAHLRMLSPALAVGGIKMTVLVKDNPQVRTFAAALQSRGLCTPTAVFGGQLADALARGSISPQAEFVLPALSTDCRTPEAAQIIQQFLREQNLPVMQMLSFSQPFSELSKTELMAATPKAISGLCGGDLLTTLSRQAHAYAVSAEEAERLTDTWMRQFTAEADGNLLRLRASLGAAAKKMVRDFEQLPTKRIRMRRVGILGAPFLKFSDVANGGLYTALEEVHAVPVFCGVTDLFLGRAESLLKGHPDINRTMQMAAHSGFSILHDIQKDFAQLVNKTGLYCAPVPAKKTDPDAELRSLTACGITEFLILQPASCTAQMDSRIAALRAEHPSLRFASATISADTTPEQIRAITAAALDHFN